MEWVVLTAFVLLAGALVALPRHAPSRATVADERETLIEERSQLLAELRELDEDAGAGRIAGEDRAAGRRAIAPRLRAVTEALRDAGALDARR